MPEPAWTELRIAELKAALARGEVTTVALAENALLRSNQNARRNTYLWQNAAWTLREAERLQIEAAGEGKPGIGHERTRLFGLPVSVKDCFDLSGNVTTCGARFYAERHGVAGRDSWLVGRLRALGAVLAGKTHLHPLAYGITGENADFGDCMQPRDATALTGGSSSGAVASVQEGSAVLAIGTDTGGSIRVPAALCGLAGYRASLGRGRWEGGAHLAPSFDTIGFFFRHLADAPLLADVLPPEGPSASVSGPLTRFAVVDDDFLQDCDPRIVESLHACARELEHVGLRKGEIDVRWWVEAYEIFAPIQAHEAAQIHAGYFDRAEASIRQRLEWGASLGHAEISALRLRHDAFRKRMDALLAEHQLILLPAAPVARLNAGADQSQSRARILRYTTPFSLAGVPAVAIPCTTGGMQLAAARSDDERLLAIAGRLGERLPAITTPES